MFSVLDSQIIHGDTVTGGITLVSYPGRFIKLTMFLEPDALRLPNVGVVGAVIIRDVVDGAAQFLLLYWGFCPWGVRALSGWCCWAYHMVILIS